MNEDYKMTIVELTEYIKSDLIVSAIYKAMETNIRDGKLDTYSFGEDVGKIINYFTEE